MPQEYRGKELYRQEDHITTPREWTPEEEDWAWQLREQGYSGRQIAESMNRSHDAVRIKMKRIKKKKGIFDDASRNEKYRLNELFLEDLQPASVLDPFCGAGRFWKTRLPGQTTDNDKDPHIQADYNLDAFAFLCQQYLQGPAYDIIDLDPYGSAYDCLDLAIRMATKGIIITLGEVGHIRFKRLDFVADRYHIDRVEDFTPDRIIEEIQRIGRIHKKRLTLYHRMDWKNQCRAYFTIEPATGRSKSNGH